MKALLEIYLRTAGVALARQHFLRERINGTKTH